MPPEQEEESEQAALTRYWNFEYRRLVAGQTVEARRRQLAALSAKLASGEVNGVSPAARWISRGPSPIVATDGRLDNGRVDTIATDPFNPDVLFFGTPGGSLWRTQDGGAHWSVFDAADCHRITSLAIDPVDTTIVYAGSDCGLFRTVDGGDHWSLLGSSLAGSPLGIGSVLSVSIDPRNAGDPARNVLLVGSNIRGLLRSTDGGANFEETPGSPFAFADSIVRDRSAPATVYASGLERKSATDLSAGSVRVIVKSVDGGAHWSRVMTGLNDNRLLVALDPSTPGTLYAVDGSCSPVHLFKSTDAGATWRLIEAVGENGPLQCQPDYDLSLAVDPADPGRIYFGGVPLYVSEDGGTRWRSDLPQPHADFHSLVFDQLGVLYAGSDGGPYRTSDQGAHWTSVALAPSLTEVYHVTPHPSDPRVAIAGTQDNGTLRRSETASWKPVNGGDGGKALVDPTDPSIVYTETQRVGAGFLYRSDDGGATFTPKVNGIDREEMGFFIAPLVMSPADPRTLYVALSRVYRSDDRAESWRAISPDLGGGIGVWSLAVSASRIYALTPYRLWTSDNDGASWSDITARLPVSCYLGVAIDRFDPQTAYVLTCWDEGHGPIYRTRDGGAVWTPVSGNLPRQLHPTSLVLIQPDPAYRSLVLASDDGVFSSGDEGVTWQSLSEGLPLTPITELAYSDNGGRLLAATYGRGVYELSCPPTPTALCLGNGRFRVTADWKTADGRSGAARAVALTEDTGYFWFFDPNNVEIILKALDACGVNRSFWIFAGGLTDVKAVITVTDTLTGAVEVYTNEQGRRFQPIQDTAAFATCGASSAAATSQAASQRAEGYPRAAVVEKLLPWLAVSAEAAPGPAPSPRPKSGAQCNGDGSSLCLSGGRFRVTAHWQTPQGLEGEGQAVALTADTGYFWFFGRENVEVVVKVLNACGFNQRFWVFAGGLTDVAVSLTILDTVTGATKTYANPQGSAFQPIQDTAAFASCSG